MDKEHFNRILRDVEANTLRLQEHGKDVLILERVAKQRGFNAFKYVKCIAKSYLDVLTFLFFPFLLNIFVLYIFTLISLKKAIYINTHKKKIRNHHYYFLSNNIYFPNIAAAMY